MLDGKQIKKDFPIFDKNPALVYLDNAASTQKPGTVIEAMEKFYKEYYANIHRSVYRLAEKATAAYEEARAAVAQFINAKETTEIIFTHNATEAINLVANSWYRQNIKEGRDKIILSLMEHHSNIVPWQLAIAGRENRQSSRSCSLLALKKKQMLDIINLTDDYRLDMEDYKRKLDQGVSLVAISHQSNVLGTINPIKEITHLAHQAGALVLVDGAQAAAHLKIDVRDLDVDFYVFSGHKMYGPTGIGVLYGKRKVLDKMSPFLGGGEMILSVTDDKIVFKESPYKFEAGTPPIAEVIGLQTAINFINQLGLANVQQYEACLTEYALSRLAEIKDCQIYGPVNSQSINKTNPLWTKRGNVIAFNLRGIHPHDLATLIDEIDSIAIRSGHHCAQPLHHYLKIAATARISLSVYNTKNDIDRAIEAIKMAKNRLQ